MPFGVYMIVFKHSDEGWSSSSYFAVCTDTYLSTAYGLGLNILKMYPALEYDS